jgi:hypothetical protein
MNKETYYELGREYTLQEEERSPTKVILSTFLSLADTLSPEERREAREEFLKGQKDARKQNDQV